MISKLWKIPRVSEEEKQIEERKKHTFRDVSKQLCQQWVFWCIGTLPPLCIMYSRFGNCIALRNYTINAVVLFTLHSHNSTYAMCCAIKGKCYFVLLILSSISPSSTEIKTDAYFFQCLIFINRCACGFRVVFFHIFCCI